MQPSDTREIRVSRIIPAPKWKVIRLLTKVNELPNFVPTVKEAAVLERHGSKIITKWQIKVDTVPVSWVEEDLIALDRSSVFFHVLEGDLPEFSGQWQFSDHPHGCEVSVTVHVGVNIPIIKDFAEDYIVRIVAKNFESILESFEQRLVSVRYASYRNGDVQKVAGFAIVGHFYNYKHFERYIISRDPGVKLPSKEFMDKIFHIMPPLKAHDIVNFRSKTGQTVNGCFILATFFPDMMEKDIFGAFSKVVKAARIGEKHGMGLVTLGGFTAIVGERIGHEVTEELDIPATSGRTFTASLVVDAVNEAVLVFERKLSELNITIVGGAGNIGSAIARVYVDKVKNLTITGTSKDNLERLAAELRKLRKAQVSVNTNNKDAVYDADIVVAAASATQAILEPGWFKPGAIVCDVGYPKNVSYLSAQRDDILLFDGGLSRSPSPLELPINVGLPAQNIMYGCFAEGIILDFEKQYANFTLQNSSITPEKISQIREMGKKHGFEPAIFYWNGVRVTGEHINRIRNIIPSAP